MISSVFVFVLGFVFVFVLGSVFLFLLGSVFVFVLGSAFVFLLGSVLVFVIASVFMLGSAFVFVLGTAFVFKTWQELVLGSTDISFPLSSLVLDLIKLLNGFGMMIGPVAVSSLVFDLMIARVPVSDFTVEVRTEVQDVVDAAIGVLEELGGVGGGGGGGRAGGGGGE